MNQQILSQDEVDALLQGITGESQKLEQEDEAEGSIRNYDLASQERIVRGRMPTMEIINERFARNLRIGLFNFIRKSPEISIGPTKVQKYSAFLREIVVPPRSRWRSATPPGPSTSASRTPRWSRSATSCTRRSRATAPSRTAAG